MLFRSSNVAYTDARDADFRGADLRRAFLTFAQLEGARFDGAKLLRLPEPTSKERRLRVPRAQRQDNRIRRGLTV